MRAVLLVLWLALYTIATFSVMPLSHGYGGIVGGFSWIGVGALGGFLIGRSLRSAK